MPYSKVVVQYQSGSAASGISVVLSFSGLGGVTKKVFTDSKGIAVVEHSSSGQAKVIVDGSTKGTMRAPGETVVFI